MAPNPSAYSQRVKLFASLLLLFSRTEALAFSVVDQCPNRPVGELGSRLSTCPLPGHLGITPEIESTITQWSSPPHCIATPIENSTEPQIDCLFSATTFRNGHGISLVTSTIHASDLVGAESFVDYPVPLSVQKREGRGPSYQIRDVPGKGKGIVATRRIRRGEIILIDVPAVLMSIAFLANTKPHHRRRLIKQAIGRLPDETQREIYALSRGKERHEMDAILGTNTNTVGLADGYPHVGLFLKLARINHSCRPNAYFRFSSRRLTAEVVSFSTIEPGEEITISYTPLELSRDERRKHLRDNWGIDCECSLCRAPQNEMIDSEGRRKHMDELGRTLSEAKENGFYKDAAQIAKDLLQFSEWENIPLLEPEHHDVLAELYFLDKDIVNAVKYARMAMDGWVRFGSVDDTEVERARVFLKKVEEMEDEINKAKYGLKWKREIKT